MRRPGLQAPLRSGNPSDRNGCRRNPPCRAALRPRREAYYGHVEEKKRQAEEMQEHSPVWSISAKPARWLMIRASAPSNSAGFIEPRVRPPPAVDPALPAGPARGRSAGHADHGRRRYETAVSREGIGDPCIGIRPRHRHDVACATGSGGRRGPKLIHQLSFGSARATVAAWVGGRVPAGPRRAGSSGT